MKRNESKGLSMLRLALMGFKGSTLMVKGCYGVVRQATASCSVLRPVAGWLWLGQSLLDVAVDCWTWLWSLVVMAKVDKRCCKAAACSRGKERSGTSRAAAN
jgi:hypothetical protein